MSNVSAQAIIVTNRFYTDLRSVVRTSGPLMLAMSGHTIMMLVDRFCLAAYSEATLIASGPAVFLAMTAISMFVGTTHVGRPLIAQKFSKSGLKSAENEAVRLLGLAIVSSLCFAITVPALIWVSDFSARSDEVVALERIYLWWSIPFGIMMILNSVGSCFFSAIDRSRVVFHANLAGQIAGIIATYSLVFGKFGAPELGIAGSAIGNLLGGIVICLSYISFLDAAFRKRILLALANCVISERPEIYVRFLRGLPIGGHQSADDAGNTAILWATSIVGAAALAANNFNIILNYISVIPILGIANGATVLTSQAIGQREYERIAGILKASLFVSLIYIGIIAIALITFSDSITGSFGLQAYSSEVFDMSVAVTQLLWLYALSFVISFVSSGVLQSFGQNTFILRSRIILMWFGSVPTAFLIAYLSAHESTRLMGIWVSLSLFELMLGLIFFAKIFRSIKSKENEFESLIG